MAADRVFVDTNILVYANQFRSPSHAKASNVLMRLAGAGVESCVSGQVLREYYGAVTRPQADGPTLDPDTASMRVQTFRSVFHVLPDSAEILDRLLTLAAEYGVSGKQIHDANIVATMAVHSVRRIVTANPTDFRRFADIIEIEPL